MSTKELALSLLNNIPEYKMGYVLAYLQGLTADENADDEYCEQLYQNYLKSEDKGGGISIEQFAEQCGVKLNEI